jgi:hypothetical protein
MKKAAALILVVFLGSGLFLVSAYSQDMEELDNSVFESPRRSPAPFLHDEHNEKAGIEDCAECHHVYDEQGNKSEYESSEDLSCFDCHELEDVGRQPGLMKAYHLNCKGCHLEEQKGPFTCGECHPR